MAEEQSTPGIAATLLDISERTTLLVREEIELAKAELTQKIISLLKGAVVALVAGIFAVIGLLFLLHGLAWGVWRWLFGGTNYYLGFFVVAGALFLLGALAGLLAARALRAGTPPKPELAIDEARRIQGALRGSGTPPQEPLP